MKNPVSPTIAAASVPIIIALVLAGCGDGEHGARSTSVFRHMEIIDQGHIALHARNGGANAVIARDGAFSVDGKAETLTPEQQSSTRNFFAQAMQLRDDALAIGKAGAAVATQALGSVAAGLASGHPDTIGPQIDAKAAKVEARANKICGDLDTLRSTQDALVVALPAFKPYATIAASEVADCAKG